MAFEDSKAQTINAASAVRQWILGLVRGLLGGVLAILRSLARAISRLPGAIGQAWRDLAMAATGVSEEHIDEAGIPEERRRFTFLGSIVIVTATWATIGACFFFAEMFSPRFPDPELLRAVPGSESAGEAHWDWHHYILTGAVPALGFLWGVMIFNIDRVFLSSMLGQTGPNRIASGCVRLFLAAILGYIISHPLKILFFSDTIAQYDTHLYLLKRSELRQASEERLEFLLGHRDEIASEIDAIDPNGITREIELAEDQLRLANDLIDRERSRDSRDSIVERYPEGLITGLRIPLSDGLSNRFNAEMLLNPGCADNDILLVEFSQNWGKEEEEADVFIGDRWLQNLQAEFREYNREEVLQLSSPGDITAPAVITSCSMGQILVALWDSRYIWLKEQEARIADRGARLTSLREELEIIQMDIIEAVEDDQDVYTNARRIVGQGYAYETTLLEELSNPHDIPERIREDPNLRELSFYSETQRRMNRYIGWAIAAVFIFVEMAPVLVKMLMSPGPYERSIAERHSERGEESAQERRQRRRYEVEAQEARLAHTNAIRSQALAFKVGAERQLNDRISAGLAEAETEADVHLLLDDGAAILEKFRRLSLEMYISADDTEDTFDRLPPGGSG